MTGITENSEDVSTNKNQKHPFIQKLERFVKLQDRAALANLRRGLGKPPKAAIEMYTYLGQFLSHETKHNYENAIFIVAALFAYYPEAKTNVGNLGAFLRQLKDESDSIEKRFVALLNAETDELPNYLYQVIGILKAKEIPVNWEQLFKDVRFWDSDKSRVRENWARSFWSNFSNTSNQNKQNTTGEKKQ